MRRVLWILVTPTIIILLLTALVEYVIFPKVSAWGLRRAQEVLHQQGDIELAVGESHLSLYRMSVILKDILVSGKIPGLTDDLKIEKIQIRIDPLGLILGQLRLSTIIIDNADLKINLDQLPKDDSNKPLPIKEIFQWSDKIPLERIALRRSQIMILSKSSKFSVQLKPLDVLITNLVQRLALRLYAPGISITSPQWQDPVGLSLETFLTLEPQKLTIQAAQALSMGQTIKLSGFVSDPSKIFIKPVGQAQMDVSSDLAPLGDKLKAFFKKTLPQLSGQIHFESEFTFQGLENFSGRANLETRDIQVGDFQAGNLRTAGSLNGQELKFNEIAISHPAGVATLKKNSFKISAPFEFSTLIEVEKLDVQKLLVALDLHQVPVWLHAQGQLPCQGRVQNFELNCTGDIQVRDLNVQTGMKSQDKAIIELEKGQASGELSINAERVKLKTNVQIGESKGTFGGEVNFKKGFDFNFATENFDFKSIKNLSHLEFHGQGSFSGFTRGDSDAAILDIKAHAKDFHFEQFFLGDINTFLRYEKGHLKLNDIEGGLPLTSYAGHVDVNFENSTISGAIKLPKTDLKDIAAILEGLYKFPFDVTGPGSGEAEFSGPFNFWKMSYNLKSSFRNVVAQGESFSSLDFNVVSHNGLIEAQQVELKKNLSLLKVTGSIQPDHLAQLNIDGSNWRMEESELVNKIKSNLVGALNFNANLTGSILSPEISAKGHLAELLVDEQEIPSSFFQIKLNKNALQGETNLFGNKIQGDFKFPLGDSHEELKIRAKTTDWNFSNALVLLGASQLQQEYDSQITSEIDLTSETGDWRNMTGSVSVKNFFLKRGTLSMKNVEPIDIKLNKGNINIKKFLLTGPNTDIQIRGENFSVNDLDLSIEANSDLRLAHIFLPFLEDIGGPFQFNATLTGSYKRPEVLGNAHIENTFIKLKGFPHPVEKLRADLIFSHSRILLQNIKGIMAGGNVNGEGSINIAGINDTPMNIRINAENLNLNFPDKIKSQGNAKLNFSGRWFPFVLSGTYNVVSGLVEKDFGGDESAPTQIRESIYLPKSLKEASFDPILIDLQINMDRNVLVKNSVMDGAVSGRLQVKGPTTKPSILGKIDIEKASKLIFKDKIFEVQSGSATFIDPQEINPEIFLSAQARVNDYDVNLLVQGPAKNLTFRYSSVPPLPEPEIVSLLALGITSQKLDQSVQSREQANQIGYEVIGATVGSSADKYLQSKLGVNLQITSGFDSTKNVNVPKVTFSKKLSRKWSTTFSQGMGTEQTSREVKIQYQINNNLSAVGSWEGREVEEGTSVQSVTKESQSVFGLDLEFKREFK